MKRILTISLLLALGSAAIAQNPVVVQKNAQAAAKPNTVSVAAAPAKPSPITVKVMPVATHKPPVVAVKPVPQPTKPEVVAVKPTAQSKSAVVAAQPVKTPTPAKPVTVSTKPGVVSAAPSKPPVAVKANGPKTAAVAKADPFKSGKKQPVVAGKMANATKVDVNEKAEAKKSEDKKPKVAKVGAAGRRDPFVSPIVSISAVGSGCSSGKRCLAIDQVFLKGIVKSDNGMIAVVVNSAAKAYFLRENDPVFNGYVVKITGDSVVFKETYRDKLGKPLTRDITKTISRPVA